MKTEKTSWVRWKKGHKGLVEVCFSCGCRVVEDNWRLDRWCSGHWHTNKAEDRRRMREITAVRAEFFRIAEGRSS